MFHYFATYELFVLWWEYDHTSYYLGNKKHGDCHDFATILPRFCRGIKNGPALAEQAFPDGQHAVAIAEYSAEVSVSDESS